MRCGNTEGAANADRESAVQHAGRQLAASVLLPPQAPLTAYVAHISVPAVYTDGALDAWRPHIGVCRLLVTTSGVASRG